MKQQTEAGRPANFITVLSVLSAFAVIALHANGVFWRFDAEAAWWRSANVIESVFYFAVPVFFMITGANLIDYRDRYDTRAYAKKRAKKTLLPFLAWTALGTVYRVLLREIPVSALSPRFLLDGFLNSTLVGVYWFFFPLFCVYLCIPLFAAVEKEKRRAVFSGLAVACFILNCLIPFLIRATGAGIVFPLSVSVGSGYLLYALTGYLLKNEDPPLWGRICIYVLALGGLAAQIIGTQTLSLRAGEIVDLYKGYNNVPCVLAATGVFLAVKRLSPRLLRVPAIGRAFAALGKYTFAAYLMHWYVLDLFSKLPFVNVYSLLYRLTAPFAAFALCALAAWLLRKIPVARELVP